MSSELLNPPEEIVCVDCGGPAHLLSPPPEEWVPEPGDVLSYRCAYCAERFDIVWGEPFED